MKHHFIPLSLMTSSHSAKRISIPTFEFYLWYLFCVYMLEFLFFVFVLLFVNICVKKISEPDFLRLKESLF